MKTNSSAWLPMAVFTITLLLMPAFWGCGAENPDQDKGIQVLIPINPGIYDVSTSIVFVCPDSPNDTISVDSTGVSCEFDVTGPFDEIFGLKVVEAIVDGPPNGAEYGEYTIEVLTELRVDPCFYYQRIILEGEVTDSSVCFMGTTALDTVLATDPIYNTTCFLEYQSAFACTTYQTFYGTRVEADTSNACGAE